jgi:hypothetical protein
VTNWSKNDLNHVCHPKKMFIFSMSDMETFDTRFGLNVTTRVPLHRSAPRSLFQPGPLLQELELIPEVSGIVVPRPSSPFRQFIVHFDHA